MVGIGVLRSPMGVGALQNRLLTQFQSVV